MEFEEFFKKKKIDLEKFAKAEPELYLQLRTEYGAMGAKSFDHSKKFLFNKWRRSYHLVESVEKPKSNSTDDGGQKPYKPLFKRKAE